MKSSLLLTAILCASTFGAVQTVRVPDNGIQPQVAIGASGQTHLVYYKGDQAAGDLFYSKDSDGKVSQAIQINSQPGSAIAAGTIRGAQIALGKENRLHVIWNGGNGAKKVSVNGEETTPLLYTRLSDAGTGFEPERNLITTAAGLDGGSSIAADDKGNVLAVWHANIPGKENAEANRAVFVARSRDDGKTFAPETQLLKDQPGVCACCGLRAFISKSGAAHILFRAMRKVDDRPELLLVAPSPTADFQVVSAHPWNVAACPMSSASFAEGLAAWETASQVYFSTTAKPDQTFSPSGKAKRKHPVIAANSRGEILLAWAEDSGWAKGGFVAWQTFDRNGKPTSEPQRGDALPTWSFPAAYAKPNGDFVLIY